MAGRPLTMADVEVLEAIAPADVERRVFDRIADGCTVRGLAKELGVMASAFYVWKKRDPEREIAWAAALAARATTFAEDGIDILDDLTKPRTWIDKDGKEHFWPVTTDEIRLAEARVKHRVWLASVSDRERYGQQSKVDVNLTVNGLHLRATRSVEKLFADGGEEEEAEFEVVDGYQERSKIEDEFDMKPRLAPGKKRIALDFLEEDDEAPRRALDLSFL
jgi:hypothetical protein